MSVIKIFLVFFFLWGSLSFADTEILQQIKMFQEELENRIAPLKEQGNTLQSQITCMEETVLGSEKQISSLEEMIALKRKELVSIQEKKTRAEAEIRDGEKMIRKILSFLEQDTENRKKILSQKDRLHFFEKRLLYTALFQQMTGVYESLRGLKEAISLIEKEAEEKQMVFEELKNNLFLAQKSLQERKEGKENLLKITEGKQEKYEQLLEETKKQEQKAFLAVQALAKKEQTITSVLKESSLELSSEAKEELLSSYNNYDLSVVVDDAIFSHPLQWPVSPERGISAGFLDPSYEKFFGVPHFALDIRVPQGTGIHSPAPAFVEKVADNGLGYSYILLAHKDGLSTLYGHVSEIFVQEGELLQMGQIIGKTGGTPGTQGSGAMTTGPHLHFEVHEKGEAKDPLNFLPPMKAEGA
jgi:murein DD-endopeptidase MepM/ murein hydrolase activator NlpD